MKRNCGKAFLGLFMFCLALYAAQIPNPPLVGDIQDVTRSARPESPNHWHEGVDIAAAVGTPVYAIASGQVTQKFYAYDNSGNALGWALQINDGSKAWNYAHIDDANYPMPNVGDQVSAGDTIGNVGNVPGYVNQTPSAAHMHLALRDATKFYEPLDYISVDDVDSPLIRDIRMLKGNSSTDYFADNAPIYGAVDIVAWAEDKNGQAGWAAGIYNIGYELHQFGTLRASGVLFNSATDKPLPSGSSDAYFSYGGQSQTKPQFPDQLFWYQVTNTYGDANKVWNTKQRPTGADAVLSEEALIKDGRMTLQVVARDYSANQNRASRDLVIDNFAPYLEAVSIKTGSTNNLRYSANWGATVNGNGELDSEVTKNAGIDALSKWTVTLTFSEEMDVSVTPTVKVKFPNGTMRTLTSPPSTPPTWSADGKTFTMITSTRPLGTDPLSGTSATLSVTAKDAAGNDLDKNPKTPGVRQDANPIPNGDPGADENHYIHIEKWSVDIRGVVMDEAGDSKQGARIKFFRNGEFDIEIGVGIGASKGRWSRKKIPSGHYYAYAYLNGYAPRLVDLGELEEGDTRWAEIRLPAQSAISGTVRRTTDNAPVAGAILRASFKLDLSPDGDTTLLVTTDTSGDGGTFSIGSLPAGQISVEVSRSRYDTVTQDVTTVKGQMASTDFTLTPDPGILAVTVERRLDGSKIENASIKAEATNLQSGTNFQSSLNGTTDEEGKASLSNVGPALYTVSANHSEYFSDTVFNQQVLPGETLSILFRFVKKAKYTGRVLDFNDNPVQGVTVAISGSSTTLTTDADGWFTFAGLPPGSYTLTLTKTGFVTKSHSFSITDGEEKTEVIKVQKLGSMSGTVRNVAGNPLQGATVIVTGGATTKTATSDAEGSFSIADLPPGTYTITGSLTGYVTQTGSKDVLDGGNVTVMIVLPKFGGITGSVKDNNSQAINGASITISKGAASFTTTSVAGGAFSFSDLEAGTWNISASATGYSSYSGSVFVANDQDASVIITLQAVG